MTPEDLVLTPSGLRFQGWTFPCSIGRGGVRADKREGDGATPAGIWRIIGILYRPDRLPAPHPEACAIGVSDLWSDDPRDPDYNRIVRAPHGYSHERLRRADPLYDVVLVTDWNFVEPEPGNGSAIFLHRWRKPVHPTEGCIAFSPEDLLWITERIVPGRTRVIV
ncbi:L,D-transpeptidase family protein [Chachezhania antarctica]|uniref:L,D-transpeptidase family protein n=1 Tax=Chachezhania antarctica TaxID=2340860 RepID=UPI000EB535D2|nr:L,D-transpeptidase family protein [Chachezhania antarctica]